MLRNESQALANRMRAFRPALFDYCMRMTGDVMKASSLVQDSCRALAESYSGGGRMESTEEIRAFLYREARILGADSWHADTAALKNPALAASDEIPELYRLDELLRAMPGAQREAILLVERYKFTPQVAAYIAGFDASRFDAALSGAWQYLLTRLPPGAVPVGLSGAASPIEKIPHHPAPPMENQMPVTNLSEIMDELALTRRGGGVMRWFWATIAITAAAGIYYWLMISA